MRSPAFPIALAFLLAAAPFAARADVPLTQRLTWSGAIDFFATGASLAIDGPDADTTMVDTLLHPASVEVLAGDVPTDATLVQAFLYWSGTVSDNGCTGTTHDDDVDFTPPGATASVAVVADVCHCSDADVTSYDTEVCRADVTALIGDMIGSYTVDGFRASIQNRSTDNASFSLVLVYAQADLPPRRIALYDGVQTMYTAAGTLPVTTSVTLEGLEVDNPPEGDLTWYVLEGDKGGAGAEGVTLSGQPGGATIALGDDVNPVTNPMNHTINTTDPAQTGTLGVDIDRFPIDGALTWHDTSLAMTYSAGTDKYWLAYNIVGVNVFEAVFGAASTKTWVLADDADENGVPSAGDTITYTLHLENTGRAAAAPAIDDALQAEAIASWNLVDAGGGTDASSDTRLQIALPSLEVGAHADIVYDVVLADQPDGTRVENTALFDASPDGDSGKLVAPAVVIRRDSDGDGAFDGDDNCPALANPEQEDGDHDGLGDACDACPADADNDADHDAICGDVDNCPSAANSDQHDGDEDDQGDVCDACPADATNDGDGDGACEDVDDCPGLANADQLDRDHDGLGDACDACPADATNDGDDDGTCEDLDDCPGLANADQADGDHDGVGDACDACPLDPANDGDHDGHCAGVDNCPTAANEDQADVDHDGLGDACDACPDVDGDKACDGVDNCPGLANEDQADRDHDGRGDACDACPDDADNNADGDSLCGDIDNCPGVRNDDQADIDHDGLGDACDACPDVDGDKACDGVDNCPGLANEDQADADADGRGDACDACPADAHDDADHDGRCANVDNCPAMANADQADADGDGIGDACDGCADADKDGACDSVDNCPSVANAGLADKDGDGLGDACDPCPRDRDNDRDGDGICGDLDNCPGNANTAQTDTDGDGLGDACEVAPEPPVLNAAGGGCGGCGGGSAADGLVSGFGALAFLGLRRRARRRTTLVQR